MSKSLQTFGAVAVLLAAFGLAAMEHFDLGSRAAELPPALQKLLDERIVYVDPMEVLGLMYDNHAKLVLIDVRDEAEFNVFHLRDARLALLPGCNQPHESAVRYNLEAPHRKPLLELAADIPPETDAVVIMSDDEARATQAWRCLATVGVERLYILAGGVNLWLDMFGPLNDREQPNMSARAVAVTEATDQLRHFFPEPRGDRWPASFPPHPSDLPTREFTPRIQSAQPDRPVAGGCG